MALEPKVKFISINQEGTKVLLKDVTGNFGDTYYQKEDDGTFTQQTNDTGYGGDNPDKSTFGRLVFSVHNKTSGDSIIEPEDYNAGDENIDEFNIPVSNDGVYTHHLILLTKWDSGASYNEGDLVFREDVTVEPFGGNPQKLVNGSFVTLTLSELLEETILYDHSIEELHVPRVDIKIYEVIRAVSDHRFGIERKDIASLRREMTDRIALKFRADQEICTGNAFDAQGAVEAFHNMKSYV